jgi:Zn-dependent M28 family amino/carboxypeptidase
MDVLSRVALAVMFAVALSGCGRKGSDQSTREGSAPKKGSAEQRGGDSIEAELTRHVRKLAGEIGERNLEKPEAYRAAAEYIEGELRAAGYAPVRQSYTVGGIECHNIEAELPGTGDSSEIIVIGGHYDSVTGSPGANDNATGVAAMLAIARSMAGRRGSRTLRFVAFANEEPPYFQTPKMGSLVYAERCRVRGEKIVGMISLETIGFYSDEAGSQHYPPELAGEHRSTGDFIGFVSDPESRAFLDTVTTAFRRATDFPVETTTIPSSIPGAGWSDHWSFWQQGYPAIMITDTAPFRYPHYHTAIDSPDKIDFHRMSIVVTAIGTVVRELGAG